uniref:Uncharacterized protein n=1 Tax=Wolfiporia cocos TaxID=81056 RepID=A0A7G7YDS6_9APHY|nr:hypothetical protein [Wolfiporia cocos]QNH92646.1 hypothetical protein [Wolfiporia cocos]QNH92688.1 hypothetical protein [Wolfiporia cocos]
MNELRTYQTEANIFLLRSLTPSSKNLQTIGSISVAKRTLGGGVVTYSPSNALTGVTRHNIAPPLITTTNQYNYNCYGTRPVLPLLTNINSFVQRYTTNKVQTIL